MRRKPRSAISLLNAGRRLLKVGRSEEEFDRARELILAAAEKALSENDDLTEARCSLELGFHHMGHAEYALALTQLETALPAIRESGDLDELGWCLYDLSTCLGIVDGGDEDESFRVFAEAYNASRNADDLRLKVKCSTGMACWYSNLEDYEAAAPFWREAIESARATDGPLAVPEIQHVMAGFEVKRGRAPSALEMLNDAREGVVDLPGRWAINFRSRIEATAADAYRLLGEIETATKHEELAAELNIGM
ncbi:MAG: hypothetical protein CMJ48_01280 [Planctomycetaceae bacterium]|nr:hypothetical protein [Planctomycetaceae bacterium]